MQALAMEEGRTLICGVGGNIKIGTGIMYTTELVEPRSLSGP
jgi:hypothetical protein